MSQLLTIVWLKWRMLRNSLRSKKAVANQVATILGMLAALLLALVVAAGLGLAAFALTKPSIASMLQRPSRGRGPNERVSTEFIFFSIYAFIYLMWATIPLSIGSTRQFDAGKLLLYPITLRKLFAIDFVSEVANIQSVFAIPAIIAISVGAGLGSGELAATLLAAIPIALFGIALSKWLSTTIGSVFRRKRGRGETILALVGGLAGLAGALGGQIAPLIVKHAEALTILRWTPPGAAALLIDSRFNKDPGTYGAAFVLLTVLSLLLIAGTYWIARRVAMGHEGKRRRQVQTSAHENAYVGWSPPLMPDDMAAVFEKELRYALRNAQMRMLALMPLILIVVRLMNTRRFGRGFGAPADNAASEFLTYAGGLIASAGVLYVFLLLAGLSCNLFAFEDAGMRALILSPIQRTRILIGKNLAVITVALVFSTALLAVNAIIFRDIGAGTLLFVALSFICFAAITSVLGNWLSINFPKRMQYGKRQNVSGVAGVLLIPMLVLLAVPPLAATLVGYVTASMILEYATLAAIALILIGIYFFVINAQGRALSRREIQILDSIKEPDQ
ncbi:MAG TPA: hypothetical protein VLA93_09595 [Pyrinomonadaceae bacterium]|nr:hypothetical protein [Pyrinomonadaceae bacterium]